MKKVTFNLHVEVSNSELSSLIRSGLPECGIILYTLASGRKICASKREYRKTEIYDIY